MPTTCFVPGCRTGYRSCKDSEKRHLFHAPKNVDLLNKWERAIPRADKKLTPSVRVCDIHFDEASIVKDDVFTINGKEVKLTRQYWKLTDDAIPCRFPNLPAYLSKHGRKRKPPGERVCTIVSKKCRQNVGAHLCDPVVDTETPMPLVPNFEDVVEYSKSIEFPNTAWGSIVTSDEENNSKHLSIFELKRNALFGSIICKAIEIDMNLKTTVYYKNIKCTESDEIVKSKAHLESIVQKIAAMTVCQGCGPQSNISEECPSGKRMPGTNTWHSSSCAVLVKGEAKNICTNCKKFRIVLKLRNKRRDTTAKTMRKIKRKYNILSKADLIKTLKKTSATNRRIRTTINSKQIKNRCQMTTIYKLRQQIKKASTSAVEKALNSLPPNQLLSFQMCLKMAIRKPKGMRYDLHWLLECLLLRIKSPKAYLHLRNNNLLPLPSLNTIQRLIQRIPSGFGFHNFAFKAIEEFFKNKDERDRQGSLSFDEIKLNKSVDFNKEKMKFDGFVNYGDFSTDESKLKLADHALVFMYRPYMSNWVQPVGVFGSHNATPGKTIAKLLLQCIINLEKHGARVTAVVCDGAQTNKTMWNQFGISGKRENMCNKVLHPCGPVTRSLFFLGDVPHIFKCIRNHMQASKIVQIEGQRVSFDHYRAVLKADSNSGGLRAVPRLTEAHIHPNGFQKMNVRLATQLFSKSVADGMKFYRELGSPALSDSEFTEEFTRRLNYLFDLLNAKLPRQGIRPGSNDIKELDLFLDVLDKTELSSSSPALPAFASNQTVQTLRVTLASVRDVIMYLHSIGYKYVLTAKLSQDCLERFFGLVRSCGGGDDHPTVSTFLQLYRILSMYFPVKKVVHGNCEPHKEELLAFYDNCMGQSIVTESAKTTSISEIKKKLQVDPIDMFQETDILFDHDYCRIDSQDSIIYYLCGYMVYRVKDFTDCSHCHDTLKFTGNTMPKVAMLTNIKSDGCLRYCSTALFSLVSKLEYDLSKHLSKNALCGDLYWTIIHEMDVINCHGIGCVLHQQDFVPKLIHFYLCTRMHFLARQHRQKLKCSSNSKSARKLSKL